jgi:hypothetical protein
MAEWKARCNCFDDKQSSITSLVGHEGTTSAKNELTAAIVRQKAACPSNGDRCLYGVLNTVSWCGLMASECKGIWACEQMRFLLSRKKPLLGYLRLVIGRCLLL